MKKQSFKMLILITALIGSMQLVSCSKDTSGDPVAVEDESAAIVEKSSTSRGFGNGNGDCINTFPKEPLSVAEIDALTFMREEELLAKDAYVLFYSMYKMPVFNNISLSETQHALAVETLLLKYDLPDPAVNHVAGEFVNDSLQAFYTKMTTLGSTSLISALTAGATIEDMDIFTLHNYITTDVDNLDILYVFGNLERGSCNHLRAFYKLLKANGVIYVPQYISQEYFDKII
ncbi:MAG: DUF2202 domain-containing protein [Lentimicrobiaceae bacterium]|jgi:hypothetical protein